MRWNLTLSDAVHLTEVRLTDKPALLEHLAAKEIYDGTLRIPYPYTAADADVWLPTAIPNDNPRAPATWAIRNANEQLIGCIGLSNRSLDRPHAAELGYWLARPYWKRGIMTATVQAVCELALGELRMRRIHAHVFAHNTASARVLQKCGFHLEDVRKRQCIKGGRPIDLQIHVRRRSWRR